MTATPGVTGLLAGLTPDDQAQAQEAFEQMARQLGLDVAGVFTGLNAGKSLVEALGLPPGTAAVLYQRAYQLATSGRMDKAGPIFRVLCLIEPAAARNWLGLAIAEHREDRTDSAAAAFAAAIEREPYWAVARFHALDFHLRLGHWDEAAGHLAAFDQASKTDVPNRMLHEAERLRTALALARQRLNSAGSRG